MARQTMENSVFSLKPIGIIRSEHTIPEKTPIQPLFAEACEGEAELFPEYAGGLKDIEGFSHIILIYWLHKADPAKMLVKPFLEDVERGIFATRHPRRPNPMGLSIVKLLGRAGPVLRIRGVDVLDGTPLLDIKPYSVRFDCFPDARNGWYEGIDRDTENKRGKRGYDAGAAGVAP